MFKKFLFFVFLTLLFTFFILIFIFIMKLIGFKYDSLLSIFMFFILTEIISYPFEKLLKYLIGKMIEYESINTKLINILYIVGYTNIMFFSFTIIDYFMNSISTNLIIVLVISLLGSFLSLKLDITEK